VAIVGGGPGGYVAAIKAGQLGLKVRTNSVFVRDTAADDDDDVVLVLARCDGCAAGGCLKQSSSTTTPRTTLLQHYPPLVLVCAINLTYFILLFSLPPLHSLDGVH
jgi:hypothetical protein